MVVGVMIVAVLCAGFSAMIANSKGRSVGRFAVAGLLLGVIGLIWAACARPADELEARSLARRHSEWDAERAEAERERRWLKLSREGGLPELRWPDDRT